MLVITSVRDVVSDRFLGFQICRNVKESVRGFVDAMAFVEHGANDLLVNHPEDFQLWILGYFDEDTGEIDPIQQLILTGLMAKKMLDDSIDYDSIDFDDFDDDFEEGDFQ